ncbi:MAG: aminotransferase class IV [Solirubrobacteraceae bacterium]
MTSPDRSAGVFETLLVRDGRVQARDRHLARLAASVAGLYDRSLPPGLDDQVNQRTRGLTGAHRLRVDAVPFPAELRIALTTSPLDPQRARRWACTPLTLPGGQGDHKWCDRTRLSVPEGVALLVDEDDAVLEAAWANVWMLDGRRLITPPVDGRILPGVTRARLLELAPSLGLQPEQRRISLDEARAAPAIILTSSLTLAAGAAVGTVPAPEDGTVQAIREALLAGEWS